MEGREWLKLADLIQKSTLSYSYEQCEDGCCSVSIDYIDGNALAALIQSFVHNTPELACPSTP